MIQKFLDILNLASAVTVDDGALLSDWEVKELTGEPDNQVVQVSWTDGECYYEEILTEKGISEGTLDSDGKFIVKNSEGETTVLRFFKVERITDASSLPTQADSVRRMLIRLTEKVERANSLHHSGGKVLAEDWSELFQLTKEARGILGQVG